MVAPVFFSTWLIFFLSVVSTALLDAAEFTASVAQTPVPLNERFYLHLQLKEASPKEAPNLFALKKNFTVHSQQQSTRIAIVNGKTAAHITWKVALTPHQEGTLQIPPITIDTSEGLLSTQPITLNVIKGGSVPPGQVDNRQGLNLITKVSQASPYKNEPCIYTALLTSHNPLYNLQAQKLQVDEAIVELMGEPKLEERIIEGVRLHVVEFTYLITPLKAGPLMIPPIAIEGAIPPKRTGPFDSFFGDELDPFAGVPGFAPLKSFTLTTETLQLDVQPPVPDVSPWLPAKMLSVEELPSDDQELRVGEPFSRSFRLEAEGIKASQLPHLEQWQGQTFKVYADKPTEQEYLSAGTLYSERQARYTLIPQQAGSCTLPEISIHWWDSVNKTKRTATIPARTLEVLPARLATAATIAPEIALGPVITPNSQRSALATSPPLWLYSLIGILAVLLAMALLWVCALRRQIARLTADTSQKTIKRLATKSKPAAWTPKAATCKEKKAALPDLNPT